MNELLMCDLYANHARSSRHLEVLYGGSTHNILSIRILMDLVDRRCKKSNEHCTVTEKNHGWDRGSRDSHLTRKNQRSSSCTGPRNFSVNSLVTKSGRARPSFREIFFLSSLSVFRLSLPAAILGGGDPLLFVELEE